MSTQLIIVYDELRRSLFRKRGKTTQKSGDCFWKIRLDFLTAPSGAGPPEIVAQTTDPPVIAPHGADPPESECVCIACCL